MAKPIELLTHTQSNWLVGIESEVFQGLLNQRLTELSVCKTPPVIFLVERDPASFLAGFFAACLTDCTVVLCNPDWGNLEWQQVLARLQPKLIWGEYPTAVTSLLADRPGTSSPSSSLGQNGAPMILIATGGSSGEMRFAMHTWDTLMASVAGFQQYFQVQSVNSICVLPLYHVSGLMLCLRSLASGGRVWFSDLRAICAGGWCDRIPSETFLSLVPTQLQRLLQHDTAQKWLIQMQTVLLGGAAAWPELLACARSAQIRLAPTYGMTETASQIATLKPDDFLKGKSGCGQVLPHARVTISDEENRLLPAGQVGQITIQSSSLAWGYYPRPFSESSGFQPGDLGFLDAEGFLYITGRMSQVIHTGGKKVYPEEVEAAIRATGLVRDVYVLGMNDRHWGEAVSVVYVPSQPESTPDLIQQALADHLSRYKFPKYWLAVDPLPRNAQGKINRGEVLRLLNRYPVCPTAATIV